MNQALRCSTSCLTVGARRSAARQGGAAVVAALLMVSLAVAIVSGLLWQQHVQMRALENLRLNSQAQWLQRAALDWGRLILRDDLRRSNTDHLGEVWAVPLAETRLSDFLGQTDNAGTRQTLDGLPESFLSGQIVDAQGRFNLTNLLQNAKPVGTDEDYFVASDTSPADILAYARLLTLLGLPPRLAEATANVMLESWRIPATGSGKTQRKPLEDVQDLAQIPGYDAAALAQLKNFVVILPRRTRLNANTVSPEVLAASVEGLSVNAAQQLVQRRQQAHFRNLGDVQNVVGAIAPNLPLERFNGILEVTSNYFLVYGLVRHAHAQRLQVALVGRDNPGNNTPTRVLWLRPTDTLPPANTR